MEHVLDILIKIQNLDHEIKDTKIQIDKIPNKIATLEKETESTKLALEEKQNRMQDIRKTYKIKEGDIAENDSKRSKLNSQTFAVKTNEEYRALINEIDYLKKANKKVEDEMINLLEEEEKLKNTIGKTEAESKEFVNKKADEISELKRNREELIKKLEQMKISFDEYFNKLPDDVTELYNKIKKVRGNVVCLIDNETCTGCYANLTLQFFNELKKKEEILLCDNCGRILIYAVPNE
ncbi:hypothetical protein KAX97_03755 [candidate division WOR-3 bacterium]|nr:hypothetical protein [candidate division WOR-3 bacterium]